MKIPKQVMEIAKIASDDDSRIAIQSVHFFRGPDGKAVAEATDGKRLMRVKWHEIDEQYPMVDGVKIDEKVKGFDVIASTEGMEVAKRAVPRRPSLPIMEQIVLDEAKTTKNGHVYFTAGEVGQPVTSQVTKIQEVYPDFNQVLKRPEGRPSGKPDFRIVLNAEYLASMLSVMAKFALSRSHEVTFDLYQSEISENDKKNGKCATLTPAFLTCASHEAGIEVEAVLMPIRE